MTPPRIAAPAGFPPFPGRGRILIEGDEMKVGTEQPKKSCKPRGPGKPIPKGKSLNPGGRPALPEEQKIMRNNCLAQAVKIMHEKVNDEKYMKSLRPSELQSFIELVFDRCGLPKVQHNVNDNNSKVMLVADKP